MRAKRALEIGATVALFLVLVTVGVAAWRVEHQRRLNADLADLLDNRIWDDGRFHRLLRRGADLRTIGRTSWITVLMMSAVYPDARLVARALEAGGNPNARDEDGCTALCWAMGSWPKTADEDVVRLLLVAGADPNLHGLAELDRHGKGRMASPPLHLAASQGEAAVARMLIANGAKVNGRDENGSTALIAAAENQQGESVEVLLTCGADPALRNSDGEDARAAARREWRRRSLPPRTAEHKLYLETWKRGHLRVMRALNRHRPADGKHGAE